ncbi:hypothetical protein H4R18_001680 [Coemansia javaensis]|uniref:Histone-lysine N-methyltransferase n=1 Tax=Coemansia javaensis TaxID=2761396 RepID=A0A9W8HJW3_9FUNG|nr:hypothetical protein H4R18_001680 [Coemansia javaensis]
MDTADEDGTEYEVEAIVDDRIERGKREFLLKWKGYGHDANTWEPEEHLACPAMVAAYLAQKRADAAARTKYARGFSMSRLYNCPAQHRVRVVNQVDAEQLPADFTYVNSYTRSADVPQPSAVMFPCSCPEGRPCGPGCECMAVSYYDENGLLCTDYPGPIYECNKLCRCPPSCPNRVIQRGNAIEVDVFRTESKGWGVLTRRPIRKGEYVCRYTGELLSYAEAGRRNSSDTTYLFDLDREVPHGQKALYTVDARSYGNVSRFFNHSCQPNMAIRAVYIGHLDPRFHELAFFATSDIAVGEELTFDYNPQPALLGGPAPNQDGSKFSCYCGTPLCRRFIF